MSQSMAPAPDENTTPSREYEDQVFELAHTASDWYWSELTGACGGCGMSGCHPGECQQNVNGHCTTCPVRRSTGQVRG